jgi:hypothetical protein
LNPDQLNKNKAPSKGRKEEESQKRTPSLSQKHKNLKGVKKGAKETNYVPKESPQQ